MKFTARRLLVTALLLMAVPLAFAASSTTTWTQADITTNSTNCTDITQIGSGYTKTLQTLSFTNSSTAGLCPELKMLLRYGQTSGVTSNSSWQQSVSYDASSLNAKYVGVCFNASGTNGAGCDIDSLQLTWTPGGSIDADTIEGLPQIGSDTGGFLKNLAPGIGSFILILGVMAAIAGIIYAIVGIVKSKVSV